MMTLLIFIYVLSCISAILAFKYLYSDLVYTSDLIIMFFPGLNIWMAIFFLINWFCDNYKLSSKLINWINKNK